MIWLFLLLAKDVQPVTSITPDSVFGWGGFLFGLIACAVLVYDRIRGRGRTSATLEGKIDALCLQLEVFQEAHDAMDTLLDGLIREMRDFNIEWKGIDGNNGWRSVIKKNSEAIIKISKRNERIDAVAEADRLRSGGKQQRAMDRALRDERSPGDEG